MRRPGWILLGSTATIVLAAGLVLYACGDHAREPTGPTPPEFARTKTDRVVTVTGAGTGSGHVRAQVLDEPAFDCYVVSGAAQNSSTCSQLFPWKSTVTLTATADVGSTFAGWGGACTGTSTSCKLMMTVGRSVTANFSGSGGASYALSVVGAGTGSGTVRSQTGLVPAINCTVTAGTASGACTASYPSGTGVTLTETAANGHTFDGWSGACTGPASSCTVSVTSAKSTTATFSAPAGPEATVGKWDSPVPYSIVGLHLAHLADGRFLIWGHGGDPQTWSPTTGFQPAPFTSCTDPTNCKLFCSGHTFLADGRLLVAGGHNETLGNGYGLKQASIFDGSSWSSTGSMAFGRWYPTLVELGDGQVVAISGS
jgi:Divergent InlB B-repeat domain